MWVLKRCLLAVLTSLVPVVIAACYGVPYRSVSGRTVDKASHVGVNGIRVRTMGAGADVLNETYTARGSDQQDGEFQIAYTGGAAHVVFTDVDGPANGGPYKEVSIPPPPGSADLTVELEPAGSG
jgi:hypothetical protein